MPYEKFIMDLDHCGAILRFLGGFATSAEAMGRDAYLEACPGENFHSTAHTLQRYRKANHPPNLPEAGPYETWTEVGAPTLEQRASAQWKAMLADYQPPQMDEGVREEFNKFVARRKSEMEDAWR